MDNPSVKKSQLNDLMQTAMEKVREMVDTNTIVGQPITTPDGVTLIPISKVSFGFGGAGGDYGAHLPWVRAGGVHRFGKRRWRRLGRSGAVAVMPLLDAGLAVYRDMCTFEATDIEAYQPLT